MSANWKLIGLLQVHHSQHCVRVPSSNLSETGNIFPLRVSNYEIWHIHRINKINMEIGILHFQVKSLQSINLDDCIALH